MKNFKKIFRAAIGSCFAFLMPVSLLFTQTTKVFATNGYYDYKTYNYMTTENFNYISGPDPSTGAFEARNNWGGYGDQVKLVWRKDLGGVRYYDIYAGTWNGGVNNYGWIYDYYIIKDFNYYTREENYNRRGQWKSGTKIGKIEASGVWSPSQYNDKGYELPLTVGKHTIWLCVWNSWSWTASFVKMNITIPDYKSYTIRYNPNRPSLPQSSYDVTGKMANQEKIGANVATKLSKNSFGLVGWTFQGWSKNKGDTTPTYKDEDYVTGLSQTNGDIVDLYAIWKQNKYNVVYNPNGGSGNTYQTTCIYDNQEAYQYERNKFSPPKQTGYTYTFYKWKTQGGSYVEPGNSFNNLTPDNGATYTINAEWTKSPNKYTVVYNPNKPSSATGKVVGTIKGSDVNGVGMDNQDQMQYDIYKNLADNQFSLVGWAFKGWTEKADGSGQLYSDGQSVKNLASQEGAIVNLYALWEPIRYNVDFSGNGATSGNVDSYKDIVYDKEKKELPSKDKTTFYKKTGYNFTGWNTQPDGSGKSFVYGDSKKNFIFNETTIDKDTVTLFAQWAPKKYTIKFNKNTGTGTMDDQVTTYDKVENLSKNKYTKEGYFFDTWNTKADGSGINYRDGTPISNLATGETGNDTITLYARWRPIHYNVVYDKNFECTEKCEAN